MKVKAPFHSFTPRSKAELQAAAEPHNSNVSNILPVTTLRTIDLEGKKNSGLLFSGFCVEREIFLTENAAPRLVQIRWPLSQVSKPRDLGHPCFSLSKQHRFQEVEF
jgi:hypothetical protein